MPAFSNRLGQLAPYPFVEISRIIAEKRAAGADVVTFGIGDRIFRRRSPSSTGC